MKYIEFNVIGQTAILTRNPASMADKPKVGNKKVTVPPEEEAEAGTYRLQDGNLGFPSAGVRKSILSGTAGMRFNKKIARPFVAGSLLPAELLFPFTRDGQRIADYEIDIRRAVVNKAGIMRSRPRLECPWEVECRFVFNGLGLENDAALVALLVTAATEGGLIFGIGDFRMGSGGTYGTYTISDPVIRAE